MNSMESHVLRLIAENIDNPDVFTDDADGMEPIRDSLNDAIEELCMTLGHYRRRYYLAMMEYRGLYRLSPQNDEMGWVVSTWDFDNKRRLRQTNMLNLASGDPRFLNRTGPPEWWWQMGWNYLGVFPKPASKGKILELEMIAVPKRYQHDQQPIRLREQWQSAAVFRAVSEFYASRGDANRATEYFGKYLEMAGLMALHPEQAERVFQLGGYQRAPWAAERSR